MSFQDLILFLLFLFNVYLLLTLYNKAILNLELKSKTTRITNKEAIDYVNTKIYTISLIALKKVYFIVFIIYIVSILVILPLYFFGFFTNFNMASKFKQIEHIYHKDNVTITKLLPTFIHIQKLKLKNTNMTDVLKTTVETKIKKNKEILDFLTTLTKDNKSTVNVDKQFAQFIKNKECKEIFPNTFEQMYYFFDKITDDLVKFNINKCGCELEVFDF